MPRTGRPKKPLKIIKASGQFRKDRHGSTPEIEAGIPDCPSWLSDQAKEYWQEISSTLNGFGIITKLDGVSLSLLSDALADWIEYSSLAVKLKKPYYTTASGNVAQHPVVLMKNRAWDRVLKACREFGMSPASIRGVSKKDKKQDKTDDKSRFFTKSG